jgi:hypothetical protein
MLGVSIMSTSSSGKDWHRKLAADLVRETPAGFAPDGAASLEIAFGQARSAVTYALELARAHRLKAAGNVSGDAVWLQLGDGRVRFTLNRREGTILAERKGKDDVRVKWDDGQRAIVDGAGAAADVGALAEEAIDALVAAWRSGPAEHKTPSAPPPEFED